MFLIIFVPKYLENLEVKRKKFCVNTNLNKSPYREFSVFNTMINTATVQK